MSAGKLSRIAGSVFVLAAVLGGIGVPTFGAEHGTGGTTVVKQTERDTASGSEVPTTVLSDIIWN